VVLTQKVKKYSYGLLTKHGSINVVTAALLVETFSAINQQSLSYKNLTTELSVAMGPSIKYVMLEGRGPRRYDTL